LIALTMGTRRTACWSVLTWWYFSRQALGLSRRKTLEDLPSGPARLRYTQYERDVFLLSLKAGGTGLNLTAASHVVHFDL